MSTYSTGTFPSSPVVQFTTRKKFSSRVCSLMDNTSPDRREKNGMGYIKEEKSTRGRRERRRRRRRRTRERREEGMRDEVEDERKGRQRRRKEGKGG